MRIDASSSTTKIELRVDKIFGLRVLTILPGLALRPVPKMLDDPWLDDRCQ
jgi:hypothetical protein